MTTAEQKTDLLKLSAMQFAAYLQAMPQEKKWIMEPQAKYFEWVATASERGKPVVWGSFVTLPEILWAMDMIPVVMEQIAVNLAVSPDNLGHKYIDLAEQRLVADHVCSFNKTMVGMALTGDIPKPDIIVHPLQPCDSARVTYSSMAEILGVPFCAIDIPLWKNDRGYQYVADEFDRLVSFLEEKTGKNLEDDRLKEVMEYSNRAHEYMCKINELKKNVPSPLGDYPVPPLLNLAGTVECANFAEKLYKIGKGRMENGEGFLPEEKIRLGWFSTGAVFDTGLIKWMQKEFGANVINNMFGVYPEPVEDTSSKRKIFEGLARELLDMPMARECGGLAKDWLEYAIPVCKDYKLDAVFLTLNLGCKNAWALAKLLKDEIADQVGIPTLVLEMDALDSRVVSAESVRMAIKDFFGTVLL